MSHSSDVTSAYAAPSADLVTHVELPAFFAVSATKLTAMSLVTFGVYPAWWIYKNWVAIRARTNQPVSPVWRAVFGPIFLYSLLTRIDEHARECGARPGSLAGISALVFLALNVGWRLPEPWGLASFFAFTALLPANSVTRRINESLVPDAPPLAPWSVANIVGGALGAVALALAIVGSFLEG